jgi:hypothetical protein
MLTMLNNTLHISAMGVQVIGTANLWLVECVAGCSQ